MIFDPDEYEPPDTNLSIHLTDETFKEFIGQQIVVRAAPKPTMLPWVSVNFEDGGANERVTRACLAGAFACICLLIVSHHLLLFREQREEWGMRRDAADAMPTGSHGGGRGGGMEIGRASCRERV